MHCTDKDETTLLTTQEKNKIYFDQWSKKYDSDHLSSYFKYCQKILSEYMKIKDGSKVLDIGCGTGEAILMLSSSLPNSLLCGVDLSKGMIAKAKAKTHDNKRILFQAAESNFLPFKSDQFDFIFTTNSFHHYNEPVNSLLEMKRILKIGGSLFLLDVCSTKSLGIKIWDIYQRLKDKGHIKYYSLVEIADYLVFAGFKDVQLLYSESSFMKHGKLFFSVQLWKGNK